MTLAPLPVLDTMLALYRQPRDRARFDAYLKALQGPIKGDMTLPIGGFNPMGKTHVLDKLEALEAIGIERLMADSLRELSAHSVFAGVCPRMQVAFNLADDVAGGWTNRYIADYSSRFKIGALVKRGFITSMFWASEVVPEAIIRARTAQACFRTAHWLQNGPPQTLLEHVAQEEYALREAGCPEKIMVLPAEVEVHYGVTTDQSIIFNILYGDDACRSLNYPVLGFGAGVLVQDGPADARNG